VEKRKTYLLSIDALRGVAAFWVVLYHTWGFFFPDALTSHHALKLTGTPGPLFYVGLALFQTGYLGVNLFFVLSGFCIHLPQAKKFQTSGSDGLDLKVFARNRFRRLYPAYLASVVLALVLGGLIPLVQVALKRESIDVLGVILRDAGLNATFLTLFFPKSLAFNGVYWTLLYELQFYLLYPLLLPLTRRIGLVPVLLFLFVVQGWFALHPPGMENLFFTRYFEWVAGMAVAEWYLAGRSAPRGALPGGALLFIAGALCTLSQRTYFLRDILTGIGFSGVLWALATRESDGKLPLERRKALVPLGVASYSLYLIHLPLLTLGWNVATFAAKFVPRLEPLKLGVVLLVPLMPLCASWFYKRFELPYLKKKASGTESSAPDAPAPAA
jgi:peptidoglycan/LPS O-acetylase OafA/YrhL